jgi:hypothetical protein
MGQGNPMRLGLDFDNTLVSYDRLFHRIALERDWIPASCEARKVAVRDLLRSAGREEDWTRLQGEVYGPRIMEAEAHEGMLRALGTLHERGVPMVIVSHKTRTPYRGDAVDLHAAARRWLERHGFHDPARFGWPADRVFLELSQEAKIARIVDQGCTHYVDDLPEILEQLPDSIVKILFSPDDATAGRPGWQVMHRWHELPVLLQPS